MIDYSHSARAKICLNALRQGYEQLQQIGKLKYLINVDETSLTLETLSTRVLAPSSSRQVYAAASGKWRSTITAVVAVTASGDFLPPLIILRGSANGYLANKLGVDGDGKLNGVQVTFQQKAYMDESVFLIWIERILNPWVKNSNTYACRSF